MAIITILTAIGILASLTIIAALISIIHPFFRPSQITRFLHTAQPTSTDSDPKKPLHPWALVTGTTSGIGLSLARELASLGFNVVLHGRHPSKLDSVRNSLSTEFPDREFRTLVIDATTCTTSPDIFKDVVSRLSDIHLTVLISNAGGAVMGPSGDTPPIPFTPLAALSHSYVCSTIALNLTFPVLLISALIPVLSRRNQGPALIVSIGSLADLGLPLVQVYAGAKAGLACTMEGLARELKLPSPSMAISAKEHEPRRNFTVHHMRIGSVTGVSHDQTPASLFRPDATTAARAIIARVGCGRTVIEPHWSMRVGAVVFDWAPWWVKDAVFGKMTVELRDGALRGLDR